ncbi:hypothetical protein Tcan_03451 [Toxocara canis]|uniref:Uncharacterized protein n=1 Tax=Toxocara canis TaxID=6265 RepID=A0A0B2VJA6_TOXCA|nr:hypothetical protein Tcan_03451 [Toxocara canis]
MPSVLRRHQQHLWYRQLPLLSGVLRASTEVSGDAERFTPSPATFMVSSASASVGSVTCVDGSFRRCRAFYAVTSNIYGIVSFRFCRECYVRRRKFQAMPSVLRRHQQHLWYRQLPLLSGVLRASTEVSGDAERFTPSPATFMVSSASASVGSVTCVDGSFRRCRAFYAVTSNIYGIVSFRFCRECYVRRRKFQAMPSVLRRHQQHLWYRQLPLLSGVLRASTEVSGDAERFTPSPATFMVSSASASVGSVTCVDGSFRRCRAFYAVTSNIYGIVSFRFCRECYVRRRKFQAMPSVLRRHQQHLWYRQLPLLSGVLRASTEVSGDAERFTPSPATFMVSSASASVGSVTCVDGSFRRCRAFYAVTSNIYGIVSFRFCRECYVRRRKFQAMPSVLRRHQQHLWYRQLPLLSGVLRASTEVSGDAERFTPSPATFMVSSASASVGSVTCVDGSFRRCRAFYAVTSNIYGIVSFRFCRECYVRRRKFQAMPSVLRRHQQHLWYRQLPLLSGVLRASTEVSGDAERFTPSPATFMVSSASASVGSVTCVDGSFRRCRAFYAVTSNIYGIVSFRFCRECYVRRRKFQAMPSVLRRHQQHLWYRQLPLLSGKFSVSAI